MSRIALPASLAVSRQDFGMKRFDLSFANSDTGAQQGRRLAPTRWTCSLVGQEQAKATDAAAWRRLILALDGRLNQLEVWDILNPAPKGTARGVWTNQYLLGLGATSMFIVMGASQVGKTLLTGDWIGVNQTTADAQLLHVQADATADGAGNMLVQFQHPLRRPVAAGSAVVWDRPICLMRQTDTSANWSSKRPMQGGHSLSLMESWE